MSLKTNNFFLLISPSATSALSALGLALAFVALHYISALDSDSPITEYLEETSQFWLPQFYVFTELLTKNSFSNNFLLLLFWSLTGALVYAIASFLYDLVKETVEIEKSLSYVNIKRDSVIETLLLSFTVRAVSFFGWLAFCSLFFRQILPNLISAIREAVTLPLTGQILPILLVTAIILLTFHIQIVFMRLIALRTRLYSA